MSARGPDRKGCGMVFRGFFRPRTTRPNATPHSADPKRASKGRKENRVGIKITAECRARIERIRNIGERNSPLSPQVFRPIDRSTDKYCSEYHCRCRSSRRKHAAHLAHRRHELFRLFTRFFTTELIFNLLIRAFLIYNIRCIIYLKMIFLIINYVRPSIKSQIREDRLREALENEQIIKIIK